MNLSYALISPRWRKVWREVWGNKKRTALVVEEILQEAQDEDYSLVVIGAHRGQGWRKILLDDLAHQIITQVDRPVLVVR